MVDRIRTDRGHSSASAGSCMRMVGQQFSKPSVVLGFAALLAAIGPAAATELRDDYHISPGDRLELKVVGLPELGQRALVDIGGDIPLPMLGSVKVAGLTLAQVQDKIRTALSGKIVYRRTPDGKKVPHIPDADEVLVEVAEYRPIYVSGDVPRAGEHAFRPGMRIHQVLSLAGGQDPLVARIGAGFLNAFDYRSSRDANLIEYSRERAQLWRLNSEIADHVNVSGDELVKLLPRVSGAEMIAKSEAEMLALRSLDWNKEKTHLVKAVDQAEQRLKALSAQFETETKGSTADAEEFERMQRLLDKSLTSQNRVTDARRAMLISATRALQIGVQVASAEREREERTRAAARAVDQRRAALIKERDETALRVIQVQARIEANERKLVFLGNVASSGSTDEALKLQVTIKRNLPDGPRTITADENTILLPGDTVEVLVRQNLDLGSRTK
ncbi:MAG TPA: polysaccharide biosynthesis/export family protein [Bosea sp. (in: a-proteobacteria)]